MDILIDETYNPICENGDFTTGDNLEQQQQLLLVTNPGDWKQNPFVGVGLVNWINDENITGLKAEIKRQFKADGLKVNTVDLKDGQIYIDAERS